ncbi:MaoC/PaaZ C-terminal domain-containing protein [Haloarculaceae archaeon H-GB2-1]|nr:MaoC/PaaZ C-terminal domain-containing protein [Haloarculaceae archaeon H-GB1-1]MEA5387292.1 MaoC/PaaZ C-terminal domain-containing protein [Haloarculaceae archaeon H-GB11]MEA5408758.1 MaoC/PaaZ C-terminal domain-containing protein [Haloarculaceae archaeon H-GB2-1]
MDLTYFEDFETGTSERLGTYDVSREEIVEFAERYDPQPFHVDEAAAEASPFGGLVASGWHTASMTMRVLVDEHFSEAASHGALGVDELQWREPVRPGDVLAVSTTIEGMEPWDDERGLVHARTVTERDRDGATVMSMLSHVLYERREKESE